MKTAELIQLLADDAGPAPARRFAPRALAAGAAGAAISAAALFVWLGFRPLSTAATTPSFWMKAAYAVVLALAGVIMVLRLARPGGRVGAVVGAPALAVLALALLAVWETLRTGPGGMTQLWLGQSWAECPFRILALAAPIYVATALALRSMAPTRPALAGAAAGLFAGAAGAAVYGLYCQETTAAFVVLWYTLGVAGAAALGAAVGARLLRW